MDKLSNQELDLIAGRISCVYDDILGRYDGSKYPEDAYQIMISAFSKRKQQNEQIENAMKWKWGHWGKVNYPQHHKDLIDLINNLWSSYVGEKCTTSCETFDYWRKNLEKSHRYISVAFITHLIHHDKVPIIDQHNFRAMLFLLRVAERNPGNKKKPSNWQDIQNLREFLSSLSKHLKKKEREVDKFLMMYGRYCVPR